jgi:hypothetical protein
MSLKQFEIGDLSAEELEKAKSLVQQATAAIDALTDMGMLSSVGLLTVIPSEKVGELQLSFASPLVSAVEAIREAIADPTADKKDIAEMAAMTLSVLKPLQLGLAHFTRVYGDACNELISLIETVELGLEGQPAGESESVVG